MSIKSSVLLFFHINGTAGSKASAMLLVGLNQLLTIDLFYFGIKSKDLHFSYSSRMIA